MSIYSKCGNSLGSVCWHAGGSYEQMCIACTGDFMPILFIPIFFIPIFEEQAMQRYDTNCISAFINGFYRRIVKRSVSGAAASTGKFIVDIYISSHSDKCFYANLYAGYGQKKCAAARKLFIGA